MNILQVFHEGGFIMYPLLFASILVWSVALQKLWFMMTFRRQMNSLHEEAIKIINENKLTELKCPQLVAQRLGNFIDTVGRERVIAGTDCGFGTFAGFGVVDADIVYAKFEAMAEGARLATAKYWR